MKSVAALIFQQKFDSLRPSVIRSHLKILGLVFCFWDLILLEVAVLPQQKGTDLTWEVEMNRWKTGKMLTESFFSYSFYEMAGNVLRTGTGEVARFFFFFFNLSLPLHWENTSLFLGGHWSRFLPEGASTAVAAECWLHMNHFKSGCLIPMSAQHFVQPKEALYNTLGCQLGSELLLWAAHPAIGTQALCTHSCLLHCQNCLF